MVDNLEFSAYRRFFAFGCSFTQYHWPTWADLIAKEIPESYNYGRQGAGNQYIFNSVVQAHKMFGFGPEDLVIVCWTSPLREDRYMNCDWISPGNIFTTTALSNDFKKKYIDKRGCFVRDAAYIAAVTKLLQSTQVAHDFYSMVPVHSSSEYDFSLSGDWDIYQLYQDVFTTIRPSFYDLMYDGWKRPKYGFSPAFIKNRPERMPFQDSHPTTEMHKKFLECIYPKIAWSDTTMEFVTDIQDKLSSQVVTGPVFEILQPPKLL